MCVPPRRIYTGIVATWVVAGEQEGPAAGWEADGEGAEEAGALGALEVAAFGGGHERAESLEAISGYKPAGDEVPEAALDVGGEAAAGAGDVVVEEGAAGGEEVEDIAAGACLRALGAVSVSDAGEKPREVCAADEGDGGGGGGGGAAAVGAALAGGQAAPGDVAGHAELVEPGATVGGDAGGQDVALPGDGGDVEALELRNGFEQPALALELGAGGDVLPSQEEAHEVLRDDGLDLLAEPVEGVAVDAGEEATVAEFFGVSLGAEAAAHDRAFAFELGEDGVGGGERHGGALGELSDRDGAGDLHVAAEESQASVVFVHRARRKVRRQAEFGSDGGAGVENLDGGEVLGGEPHEAAVSVGNGGAARGDEIVEPGFGVRGNRRSEIGNWIWSADGEKAEEGLVELLRIAGVGARFVNDALDGIGVEGAQVAGVLRERAAQGNGAGASFLERGVVEVSVGLGIEHLVGEGGGLRGVLRVQADLACFNAFEDLLQAVDVHRFVHTVVDGLTHDRVVGDLDRAGLILLATDELREDRRH